MSIGMISRGNDEKKINIRPYIKHVGNIGLVLVFTTMATTPVAFADEGRNATQAALEFKKKVSRIKKIASTASLVCVQANEKSQQNGNSLTSRLLLVLCGAFLGWIIKPIGEL